MEVYRAGIVAIDTTEDDPFTGDQTDHEDEIIGTEEESDEYAYQWATIQLGGNTVPLVLDTQPIQKGDSQVEIVENLLEPAQELVPVDEVLMDRGFDSQHVLKAISDRHLKYVVSKRMYISGRRPIRSTATCGGTEGPDHSALLIQGHTETIITLLADTGLRVSELVARD